MIIGIGEVLWDIYGDTKLPGGAPANFVYHCRQLGEEVYLVSAVGNDPEGAQLLNRIENMGVPSISISTIFGKPTGSVQVTLTDDGLPRYLISNPAAYDFITLNERLKILAQTASVVCFGTLCQRSQISRRTIGEFLNLCPPNCWKILDLNLRNPFYTKKLIRESLIKANCVKLNENELYILADIFSLRGMEPQLIQLIRKDFDVEILTVTKGANGSVLVAPGIYLEQKGREVEVVDSVGAGDAFTAALAVGLSRNYPLDEIQIFANHLAGFVCSRKGATPELPEELKNWEL